MVISIVTGFVAGVLHVVGGADHLVAMAPNGLSKPRAALRDGLAWGLGHSTGVLALSTFAILAKDFVHVEFMSSLAEFTVGIALLLVGALAIRTSLGSQIHSHKHIHRDGHAHEHVHFHFRGRHQHGRHPHAATSLGILHGFAGASHLLVVIPALALPPIGATVYLLSYLVGSIVAMGGALFAISLATLHAGRTILPILFGFAGGLSIVTGVFWLQKTLPLFI